MGELGKHAHRFVDALAEMRQRWWQMLPVGPTGYADSPYQSPSTFAGNPLLIDLTELARNGLVAESELEDPPAFPTDVVDFGEVIPWRMAILAEVASGFPEHAGEELRNRYSEFLDRHSTVWLDEFALFTALKRAHRLRPWWEWDISLIRRQPSALASARGRLEAEIEQVRIEQFLFDHQFELLRVRCSERGVGLIGDIPIFVAHDSADVWANAELFYLDARGMPLVVAGVPPDYFSETGQRWGNPLYRWDRHAADGFSWWKARLRRVFELFDVVRIDHFRGFVASWHIPATEPTAVTGSWVRGPGTDLFDALVSEFGRLPVIAEDLGVITPEVEALRDRYRFPGMKVLQFGFGTESAHSLDRFVRRAVAYTGTHDNDTAAGWFSDPEPERRPEQLRAMRQLGTDGTAIHWDLIRAVYESVADTAIVPLQDVLGLDSEHRMNTPATEAGNWRWRFDWSQLTPAVREGLRILTCRSGRT